MLVRAFVGVSQTAVYALMVVVVIAMCPVIMFAANGLSTDIQLYTVTLVEKTRELNMEKFKTETLLYQMVPRSVADRLKSCGSVSHMNLHIVLPNIPTTYSQFVIAIFLTSIFFVAKHNPNRIYVCIFCKI